MKKSEFAEILKERLEIPTLGMANSVYDVFCSVIKEQLEKDQEVKLLGVGTFKVRMTKEGTAFNPITKQKIKKNAGRRISFKIEKSLKTTLNNNKNPIPEKEKKASKKSPIAKAAPVKEEKKTKKAK